MDKTYVIVPFNITEIFKFGTNVTLKIKMN